MNHLKTVFKYTLFSVIILFSACQDNSNGSNSMKSAENNGMLQHNVYFYLNDSITDAEKIEFEKGLQKLLSIKEIYKSEVGVTGATKAREVTDHDFEYSLFIWFKSMEDYEVYADHPDHMKFIETYKHLWDQVKVYDSKIISIGD